MCYEVDLLLANNTQQSSLNSFDFGGMNVLVDCDGSAFNVSQTLDECGTIALPISCHFVLFSLTPSSLHPPSHSIMDSFATDICGGLDALCDVYENMPVPFSDPYAGSCKTQPSAALVPCNGQVLPSIYANFVRRL